MAFKGFEEKIKKIVKEANPVTLLQTLLTFKTQITALPSQLKQAECTIQRFMLYLLPVFNMIKADSYLESK